MKNTGYQIKSIAVSTVHMRTRIPFKYGIATLTELPHIFLRVLVEDRHGSIHEGVAAEGLLPKWFEKDPASSADYDLQRMHGAVKNAALVARDLPVMPTVFRLWHALYQEQQRWGASQRFPALLWNFGVSMVERAVIHAVCRGEGRPFHSALRDGLLGFEIRAIHDHLPADVTGALLPARPLTHVYARHTVGLGDALGDADIVDPVSDGLPETLEQDIQAYGLGYFKIKLRGKPDEDTDRLRTIFLLLDRLGVRDYRFTLDGNEQFYDVDAFRRFWETMYSRTELRNAMDHLLFVEQPFNRTVALTDELGDDLTGWEEHPPMIIDESDGAINDVPRAIEIGYDGASYKSCKGVFKGVANRLYLEHLNRDGRRRPTIMSGEDLANIGPVALLQDLAAVSTLGIPHVERNGHHYFRGLSMFSDQLQNEIRSTHPDLYALSGQGHTALRIVGGRIAMDSINRSSFGTELVPQESPYVDISDWQCPTLES